jgi:hypothetical protein
MSKFIDMLNVLAHASCNEYGKLVISKIIVNERNWLLLANEIILPATSFNSEQRQKFLGQALKHGAMKIETNGGSIIVEKELSK